MRSYHQRASDDIRDAEARFVSAAYRETFTGETKPTQWNLDGVSWFESPIPGLLHRCRVQTYGRLPDTLMISRCSCGGLLMLQPHAKWMERNSRVLSGEDQ